MSPRFSDRERELIRQRLMRAGERRFTSAGLQKTSVDQLCRDAAIAKGSFYSFFGSKEELFVAVMGRFAREKSEAAAAAASESSASAAEALRAFIVNGATAMADGTSEGHHAFRQEDSDLALRKLPPEVVMRYVNAGEHWLAPAVRVWQQRGLAEGMDPQVVAELVASVVFLPLNPGVERGPRFDAAFELLVDAVVDRLSR